MQRGKSAKTQANGKTISKLEAVRQALTALGRDSRPSDIQDFIKKNFDVDMDNTSISKYKSKLLSDSKKKKGRGGRKSKALAPVYAGTLMSVVQGDPAPRKVKTAESSVGEISMDDIRSVKELLKKIGAEKIRQLAEILAR